MCNYKILSHTEEGYIIFCNNCKHYQLAFGTTAATFHPDDFKKICRQVDELKQTTACNGFEKQKRITVELFCKCVMMVLSYTELLKLHNLLNEATFNEEIDIMFEHLKLIRE